MADEFQPRLPELIPPQKIPTNVPPPNLPPEIAGKLSPQEIWMMTTLINIENEQNWNTNAQIANRRYLRDLDVVQQRQQKWIDLFSGKWGIIGGIGALIAAALLGAIGKVLIEKLMRP